MKGLIKYALVAAMVFATAMPAMAASWVVCIDENKDFRPATRRWAPPNPLFFVAAAPIYPGDTDVSAATDCTSDGRSGAGRYFLCVWRLGCGLPQSTTPDPNDELRSCGISELPAWVTLTPQGPFVRRPPTTKPSPARPILVWCLTRALR